MSARTNTRTVAPQQRRSRATKDRIFGAAASIFPKKGLEGTRVDEIARRAKVNKQRIYAYFGSKRELYRRVLIDVYARVANNPRLMALSEDDIPNMTGVAVDVFFEIHDRNPAFWRLLCWENLNGGKSLRPEDWREIRGAYIQHLRELYAVGQCRGVIRRDVDFSTYLMLLFSTTYFYFSNQLTLSRLLSMELDRGDVRQQIERQLLAVIADGVRGR